MLDLDSIVAARRENERWHAYWAFPLTEAHRITMSAGEEKILGVALDDTPGLGNE